MVQVNRSPFGAVDLPARVRIVKRLEVDDNVSNFVLRKDLFKPFAAMTVPSVGRLRVFEYPSARQR